MANERTVEIRLRVAAPGADAVFAALSKGGDDVAKHLRGASVSMDGLAGSSGKATAALTLKAKTMEGLRDVTRSYAAQLGPVGSTIAGLGPAALGAVAGFALLSKVFVDSVRFGREFEKGLANLSAITGAAGKDLDYLRGQALELGKTTTSSAVQTVEAFKLIASAKPELLENAKALASVGKEAIALAEAASTSVPDAAKLLVTSLNQFGAGAEEASRFINVLAAGAKFGAAEIPDLAVGMVKAGTEARNAGLSFEEFNAVLQKLAAFGTPAEKIGTSLRNIFLKLQSGASETNPKIVGLATALANLGAQQLTVTELTDRFGTENVTVTQQLLTVASSLGVLTGQITKTGEAYVQQRINTDTLEGSIARLHGSYAALLGAISQNQGLLRDFVDLLGLMARATTTVAEHTDGWRVIFAGVAIAVGLTTGNVALAAAAYGTLSAAQAANNAYTREAQAAAAAAAVSTGTLAAVNDVLNAGTIALNAALSTETSVILGLGSAARGASADLDALKTAQEGAIKENDDAIKRLTVEVRIREESKRLGRDQIETDLAVADALRQANGVTDVASVSRGELERTNQALIASGKDHAKAVKSEANAYQDAREAIAERIAVTEAETRAIEESIAHGDSYVETLANIAAAQLRAKGATEGETESYRQQALAAEIAEEKLRSLRAVQSFEIDNQELIDRLNAEADAIDAVVAASGKLLDIERARAVVAARQIGLRANQGPDRIREMGEEAAKQFDIARAVDARIDAQRALQANQETVADIQARIDVLNQEASGTLSLAEANQELAVAAARRDAERKGYDFSPEIEASVRAVADLQLALKNAETQARNATLGFSGVFERFATETQEWTDSIGNAFADIGQLGADALEELFISGTFDAQAFADNLKRIVVHALVEIAQQRIIIPILAQVVGAVGGFGGQPGTAGAGGGGVGGAAQLLQQGQSLLSFGKTLSSGFDSLIGAFGASTAATVDLTAATGLAASSAGIVPGTANAALFGIENAGSIAIAGQAGVAPGTGALLVDATGAPIGGASSAGAAGGLAGAASSAAILFAVVAAIETIGAAFAASKARDTFYSNRDAAKFAEKQFDPITGGIGNILTYMFTGQKAATLFESQQRSLYGGADVKDIVYTTILNILNPLNFALGIASKLPTKGTVLRHGFEEFLEHDGAAVGFFGRNSGTFARGIGQTGSLEHGGPEFLTPRQQAVIGGGTRGIQDANPGMDFVDAQREFIRLQKESIGLTDDQLKQVTGLAAAFRAIVGGKAGQEETRTYGLIADFLGSITAEGAGAAEALDIVAEAVAGIGRPEIIFERLNQFFTSADNDLPVEQYRDAIQGLALALFQDLPKGVDAAALALDELNKAGNGNVTFEAIEKRIAAATLEANALGDALHDAFVSGLVSDKIDVAAFSKDIFDQVQEAFKKTIVENAFDELIQGAFKGDVLGPVLAEFEAIKDKLDSGDITLTEANRLRAEAVREGRDALESLRPLFDEMIAAGKELADVFNEADDSVLGLATAIVKLQDAQRQFNDSLDARIFALRNKGQQSPDIIKRDLPDIEREFRLTQLKLGASISEVVAAANAGIIKPSELPDYLAYAKGGPKELSAEDKLAALVKLQGLAERDLEIRIAAINAETAAAVQMHQDNISRLQRERDEIQRNAKAAIDAKQDELDAVQEALATSQAWKQTLESVKQTLLGIETGSGSPDSPVQRLQTLQAEFFAQRDRFNDISLTDEQRQEAAAKLADLGPRILQQAQDAGIAQSSEAFRAIYEQVVRALDLIAGEAGAKSADTDALIEQQTQLQADIKAIQEQSEAQLEAIDASIRSEQDAITELQRSAEEKIAQVSANTAGVLEWIQGQGNAIFEQKQDELKAKLEALGVTDISIESIQASSLSELQRIRELIEGQGSTIVNGPVDSDADSGTTASAGRYGITAEGVERAKDTVSGLGTGGDTYSRLGALVGITSSNLQSIRANGGALALLLDTLAQLFPGAKSAGAFSTIAAEFRHKIEDASYVSPVLGFGTGGLVRGSTIARVGESGPELILPLSQALRMFEVRRAFEAIAGPREKPAASHPGTYIDKQETRITVEVHIHGLDTTNPAEVKAAIEPVFAEVASKILGNNQTVRGKVARIAVEAVKLRPAA